MSTWILYPVRIDFGISGIALTDNSLGERLGKAQPNKSEWMLFLRSSDSLLLNSFGQNLQRKQADRSGPHVYSIGQASLHCRYHECHPSNSLVAILSISFPALFPLPFLPLPFLHLPYLPLPLLLLHLLPLLPLPLYPLPILSILSILRLLRLPEHLQPPPPRADPGGEIGALDRQQHLRGRSDTAQGYHQHPVQGLAAMREIVETVQLDDDIWHAAWEKMVAGRTGVESGTVAARHLYEQDLGSESERRERVHVELCGHAAFCNGPQVRCAAHQLEADEPAARPAIFADWAFRPGRVWARRRGDFAEASIARSTRWVWLGERGWEDLLSVFD